MEILPFIFLGIAGLAAGFIDSVAGGGGLIGLPALLAAGVPPHVALGTNKFQSTLGTTCALINFTRKAKVIWKIAVVGIPFSLIGSVLGARTALIVDSGSLAKIMIILLPPVTAFIFFSKKIFKAVPRPSVSRSNLFIVTPIVCLTIGIYDGFFGPGTGTFLILALVLFSRIALINATATAKTFNLASNCGAFVTFIVSGHVYFPYAITMAAFNITGNIIGSQFAIKRGQDFIRKILAVSLTLLFIYLAWKYFLG